MSDPQREHLDAPVLKVGYKYTSVEEFIREANNDISLFGIFIKTKSPLKEGVTLRLEFRLDDGKPFIHGLGQVVWRREVAQSDDRPAGMGVKFLNLDGVSRYTVERAVAARGLVPSRFDRLGETLARHSNESERPVHTRSITPVVTEVADMLNSDALSSLSPFSYAPTGASWPADADSRGSSLPPEISLSEPNQVEESDVSSSEHPDQVELAARSSSSAPKEAAQPLAEQINAISDAPFIAEPRTQPVELSELTELAVNPSESVPEEATQPSAERMNAISEAPIIEESRTYPRVALRLVGRGDASTTPPATTFAAVAPQENTKLLGTINATNDNANESISVTRFIGSISGTGDDTGELVRAARNDTDESERASKRAELIGLRERLAKQAANEPPAVTIVRESAQRGERVAEFSKAETDVYAVARRRRQWAQIEAINNRASEPISRGVRRAAEAERRASTATLNVAHWVLQLISRMWVRAAEAVRIATESTWATLIQRRRELASSALLALLLVGGVSAFWMMGQKTWQTARIWSSKTNRALVAVGGELHRSVEEMGLVEGLRAESEQEAERRLTRYLLKVVTDPVGAAVTVAGKHFVTPCEVDLSRPEGALRIYVNRKSYRSIQRNVTAKDFQPEGDFLTYTLDLRLKKLPPDKPQVKSATSRFCSDDCVPKSPPCPPDKSQAAPPAPAVKRSKPTFYLEPMPPFPKQ